MNYLIIITGPTGVGKTELAIKVAQNYNAEIISADSRQIYKEMRIGTAVPSSQELSKVKHHFIQNISIEDYYNVSRFEQEAITLISELHKKNKFVVLAGGTGLYINAICNGIDIMPDPNQQIREGLNNRLKIEGIEVLQEELKSYDPEYYKIVDLKNPARLIRALEICHQTGKTYTSFRTKEPKSRDFKTIKIALNIDREKLYDRINKRVNNMVSEGLLEEVKTLIPHKSLSALKTVGYRELFDAFDGLYSMEEGIEKIQNSSRAYARKQISWIRRDGEYEWFEPQQEKDIIDFIESKL